MSQAVEKQLKQTQIVSEIEKERLKKLRIDEGKNAQTRQVLSDEQFMDNLMQEINTGNQKSKGQKVIKVGVQKIFTTHDLRYDIPDVVG